jgi:hypothetical protein
VAGTEPGSYAARSDPVREILQFVRANAEPTQPAGPGPLPEGYGNWRAFLTGARERGAAEFALYTDAHVTGQVLDRLGPYQLINTIAFDLTARGEPRAGVVLRVAHHADNSDQGPDMAQTRDAAWHGGFLDEEFAALLALSLGMRCKAAGCTRQFELGRDPRGMPVEYLRAPPYLPPLARKPQIPRAAGTHLLDDAIELLQRYPRLRVDDAVALLRAARSYQEGLWVSESDPEYAWLKLISAVETAANRSWSGEPDATVLLREWDAGLAAALEAAGGIELLTRAAERLAPATRATHKFLSFLDTFLPPPPEHRPPPALRVDWDDMRDLLSLIYRYRSEALHGGKPFPAPLLWPPMKPFPDQPPEERPIGQGAAQGQHVWQEADLPMHLHFFEHVARGALQAWWLSMPPETEDPALPQAEVAR